MKRHLVMSAILSGVFPAIVLALFFNHTKHPYVVDSDIANDTEQAISEYSEPLANDDTKLNVMLKTDMGVMTLDLEEYVTGVVLGEMPVDFEVEALKAQSVVARTYTCKKLNAPKHTDAQVCSDSMCCQAFVSENEFLMSGGSETALNQVKNAVAATKGEVLVYNGELIEATYFSCSGGKTETAKEVWGGNVPYLQSVESPGEEIATHYMDTVKFSAEEFCKLIGTELIGNPELWIEHITYTEGGGVDTIVLSGQTFTGVELRKRLNLRSTAFVITAVRDTITITTKGFGHRVGMSQYGAEAMAIKGSDYRSILSHYYQGTVLASIFG